MLTGENGLLSQAQRAKEETEQAQADEERTLESYEQYLEGITNGGSLATVTGKETENTKLKDSLGNTVWIPAGFKVVNPGDNVEDGIIIEDVSNRETVGSQFVWIPVGTIKTTKGEKTINLDRYTFEKNGNETAWGEEIINNYCQELSESNQNTPAKDINEFKEKVKGIYKGYYIGRYEAKDGTTKSARTRDTSDENILVCTENNYLYNFVTQPQAANLSRNMYSNDNFKSDLVNSYAWDTALVFIQECSGDNDYSQQKSINTSNLAEKGTKGTKTEDLKCNIYDMASNCCEWTTETSSYPGFPSVRRGGVFNDSNYYSSRRSSLDIYIYDNANSFRPILYL